MHCVACGASLPDDHEGPCAACAAEPRLEGRFSLRAPIGAGAHGTTWDALDARTGVRVAVKELPLRLGAPDKIIALFRREAEVLRQLDHPAIPSLIDAFEAGQGRQRALWIAMDFVEGRTLAQELEAHRYDEHEVLGILEELCGVLAYLHSRQPPVVHRDLKPGNVIRRPDGRLAVVDFGSVRDAMRCADLGGSTVAGTFGYMAPEQFAGDAEPRSDLYAIGALGVHLLTRKVPHSLQRPGRPIAFSEHAALRPEVEGLLAELVALDPADRPSSAADVAARIRAIRRGPQRGAPEGSQPAGERTREVGTGLPDPAGTARGGGRARAANATPAASGSESSALQAYVSEVDAESAPAAPTVETLRSPSPVAAVRPAVAEPAAAGGRSAAAASAGRRIPAPVATVGPEPTWITPRRPASLLSDELRLTVHAARPVQAGDEGAILDAIAETIGLDGEGRMTAGGYRWQSRVAGRTVRLAIDTVDAGARIRVIEDHTPATLGYLFGLGGGVVGGVGGGVGWIFFREFGLAAGFVFLAGLIVSMGLLSVGASRTSRRVRDERSAMLAAALQERLGGPTGAAPQLPRLPERPLYTSAAGVAAATLWTLFDLAGAPLGPWWVALIVLAGSLGGLSPGKKGRKKPLDAERRAAAEAPAVATAEAQASGPEATPDRTDDADARRRATAHRSKTKAPSS